MAQRYNISIDQGSDFALSINYNDPTGNAMNLTGFTARMAVRTSYAAPTALISLTTENGGIEIVGANGTINLSFTAANTANIPACNAVYDLELVNGDRVERLIEGSFTITPEVTR